MDYASHLHDDRFVIFLFHGVIKKNACSLRNYTRKHLEVDYFKKALESLLATGGNPVSMDEVVMRHEAEERLPPKSFVVTFDDGFRNSFEVAAPVLEELSIPATFYVTTEFIDSNRMSWIDRIELAMERTHQSCLYLPWKNPHDLTTLAGKRQALDDIRGRVKNDRFIDTDVFASKIQLRLGFPRTWSSDDPLDQKMSWDQVWQLHHHSLFKVGGHSHTHATLAFLSKEALERELTLSFDLLCLKGGVVPRHYSYPEGLEHCYSESIITSLKRCGVVACPTAIDGDNDTSSDLFHLRRVMAV